MGSDKGFHLQMLLECLEKYLYLPAVFVDGGNGAGTKFEVVGQKNEFPLVPLIPDDHATEQMRASFYCSGSSKLDYLVSQDGTMLGNDSFFDNLVNGIFFLPSNEKYVVDGPGRKQSIVVIRPIESDD